LIIRCNIADKNSRTRKTPRRLERPVFPLFICICIAKRAFSKKWKYAREGGALSKRNENGGGIFCLQVVTTRECYVERFLRSKKISVISAFSYLYVYKKVKANRRMKPLLPGYVLFSSENTPDWDEITWLPAVLRPLQYADNARALRGRDLDFVSSLIKNNGVYKTSKAIPDGSKIKIIDGPLKNFEGDIIKVNRRKGRALIRIPGDSILNNIWLGFEMLEKAV
jgi:transcriptional antiterminator NusG